MESIQSVTSTFELKEYAGCNFNNILGSYLVTACVPFIGQLLTESMMEKLSKLQTLHIISSDKDRTYKAENAKKIEEVFECKKMFQIAALINDIIVIVLIASSSMILTNPILLGMAGLGLLLKTMGDIVSIINTENQLEDYKKGTLTMDDFIFKNDLVNVTKQ
jgi:hypothetical protein